MDWDRNVDNLYLWPIANLLSLSAVMQEYPQNPYNDGKSLILILLNTTTTTTTTITTTTITTITTTTTTAATITTTTTTAYFSC